MARTDTLGHFLTDVADAIREKEGTSETIPADEFDTRIENIPSGGKYAPKFIKFQNFTGTDLTTETTNLDTSNMTEMKQMFANCTYLATIDASGFNTSNVTTMEAMFNYCTNNLVELDLSSFDTSNVTRMTNMFANCRVLTKLDIRNFDFTNVSNSSYMFSNVPTNCLIIVKSNTEKEWITSRFTDLTNVKTVAEYEA